jgi:large conductance mechanosensitive channel
MSMLQEFKTFAMRGNVVDMAVGVVIGAAFGKIVSAAVEDMIMPPIGLIVGGVDFSDLVVTLKQAHGDTPAVVWKYGHFLQTIFDFIIVAWAIFMLVQLINRLRKPDKPADPPGPTLDQTLLIEIRDLLRANAVAAPDAAKPVEPGHSSI